jgi:HSP90 family molecular chaperone
MKEGQEAIYYITADSFAAARNSPHLEIFRKRNVEVLLMYDRIDEWVASSLTEFEGKALHSVAKGDLDLSKVGGDAAQAETPKSDAEAKPLLEHMQAVLQDRASAVRATERLTESPACFVSDEHGMSMNLERILKAAGRAISKDILEFRERVLVIVATRGVSTSDADPGHGSVRLLVRPRGPLRSADRLHTHGPMDPDGRKAVSSRRSCCRVD